MDFRLSPDQAAFKQKAREFAEDCLTPLLPSEEEKGRFPVEAWRACGEFGVQGLPFPREFGGGEYDLVSFVAAMEALGYGCADSGLLFAINAQMLSVQAPISSFGSPEQKQRYLPGLIDGTLIGAHGMTEPESGSNAFGLSTTARKQGDNYVLNGSKAFITNAPVADVFLVFATVDKNDGFMGITAFLIDKGTPGLTVSPSWGKLGLASAPLGAIFLDDCRVPAEQRLGREGAGFRIFNDSMDWERGLILSHYLGAMQRQIEHCVDHVRETGSTRSAPGVIAGMRLRLEAARLLIYRVAYLKQNVGKCTPQAAMAKLYVSEAWHQNSLDAAQVLGSYAVQSSEHDLLDSLGGLTYSGTSDIQRNLIAQSLWPGLEA